MLLINSVSKEESKIALNIGTHLKDILGCEKIVEIEKLCVMIEEHRKLD